MADDPPNRLDESQPKDDSSSPDHVSLVDAVYEVALDPARYDELVAQWHSELKSQSAPRADDGLVSKADSQLSDHFQRATTILERVHHDDWLTPKEQAEASANSGTMPEVLLSKTGQILHSNFGATALLSAQSGAHLESLDLTPQAISLLLEQCDQISASPPAHQAENRTAEPRVLRITRLGDDRPLVVLLSTTTFEDKGALALRCAEIIWPETLGPLLAQAFGLTTAECEIVQALVAGQNTATVAAERGTSKETVRTQIRQLLAKTGTHSQLELIRMAIGFSMMSQQAEARAGRNPSPTATHQALSTERNRANDERARSSVRTTADGGNFEFVQYGPADGDPVLVFHDEVIGDAFVLPLLRQAPDRRWLVAVRPGFGASSPIGADQINALHDALRDVLPQIAAAPIIAHGNGVFFACLFAKAHPELCSSITCIAASLPGSPDTTGVNRYAAFMAGMGRLAPSMLRFAAQAGFAMYARVGARRFVELVYGDSPIDREVISSQLAMNDLEHGSRLTLAQGYRGFLADEQALAADWSDEFIATPVPVRILIGDEDQPARRVRAELLRDRSNTVEVINVNNAGFFAAFSASTAVAETLLRT